MNRKAIIQDTNIKLSPTAVGIPQQDQSGEIIAQGMQNLSAGLLQREEKVDTLAATAKLGDFELQYTKTKSGLQQQYRDKPKEYADAAVLAGKSLLETLAKDLPTGVATKYRDLGTKLLTQDTDNLVNWGISREQEMVVGDIKTNYQNKALAAEQATSPEELGKVLTSFNDASTQARQFISPEADMHLNETSKDLAKKLSLMKQINANPTKVYRDLEGKAYEGILSSDEIAEYKNKARDAIYHRAEDNLYANLYTAQGDLLEIQQKIDSGSMSVGELITRREAAYANRTAKDANGNLIIDPNYIRGLDNAIAQITYTQGKFEVTKEARKDALTKFDNNWEQYLLNKKLSKDNNPNVKDVQFELSVYADLSDLYHQGIITKPDFDEKVSVMQTKLALRAGQGAKVFSFSQSIQQAGRQNFFPWVRDRSDDVFAYGYKEIKTYVDKAYSTLDETSKQEMKAQMLSQYTRRVRAVPDEIMKGLSTELVRRKLAHSLVYGGQTAEGQVDPGILSKFSFYQDPGSRRTLFAGDTITQNGIGKTFMGVNAETGQPMWQLAPFAKDQIITNSKGNKAKVVGLNADGTPILQRMQ